MTTVVTSNNVDEDSPMKSHTKSITVTKLLTRPQTAVPSISPSQKKDQKIFSSIKVLGQEKEAVDIKKRIKSAVSGQSYNRRTKQQQGVEVSGKDIPYRIHSAAPNTSRNHNACDIPPIKETVLLKSFSCPSFNLDSKISLPVSDSRRETVNTSRPIVVKGLRELKTTSLSIKSASVVLTNRPGSSASISKRFQHTRPKTAAALLRECQLNDSEVSQGKDEQGILVNRVDSNTTSSGEVTSNQSLAATISEVGTSLPLSGTGEKGTPRIIDLNTLSSDKQQLSVSDNNGCKQSDHLNKDGAHGVHSGELTNHQKDLSAALADKGDVRLQISADQSAKQVVNKTNDNKSRTLTTRYRCDEESDNSCDSLTIQHCPPHQVTSPERDLAPVCCSSSQSKPVSSSLLTLKTSNTENRNDLTFPATTKETNNLTPRTKLNLSALNLNGKTELANNIISSAPNSPSPDLTSSSRVYKMAKVEMYEKNTVKRAKSILDEIKKQNLLLEERNSEIGWNEDISNKQKKDHAVETAKESKNEVMIFAEKGNICGSPGFKFLSDHLRSMNTSGRPGSNMNTKKSNSKNVRESQGDSSSTKLDQDSKHNKIRPLSDYVVKSSPLDNLRLTGGAITYKSGEHAVSNAAENIASQAGIVSKVSLQKTQTRSDTLDNTADAPDSNSIQSKVHVSLSCLKEKNRVNSNAVTFRYRLDGYQDHSNLTNTIVGSKISQANQDKTTNHEKSRSRVNDTNAHSTGNTDGYSGAENSDSEKLENDVESAPTSASSTPTAAFSGSELLYPNDGVHRSHGEELSASDMPGYERERQKLKDLEIGNRRPVSRSKRTSYSVVDKVSFDRERDDLRALNNSLPAKAPVLRNPVHRNSLVRGEPMISNRTIGSNSNRESEDLIAMGTIWNPANNNNNSSNGGGGGSSTAPTRSSSNTTGSNKSVPLNNNINSSNCMPQRKPVTVSMSTSARLGHCNGTSIGGGGHGKNTNRENMKEVEPKYSDPLMGAPASFQQRLMDLASLEAETIRWERTKRVKKKPKDRDS